MGVSELVADRRRTAWWLGPDGAPGPMLWECLTAAIAAPSVHNTQPWLFRPHARAVDVYADWRRQLPVVDPSGRELLISVGAAVFNLRVAIRAHGRMPLQLLLPAPGTPDLVARVSPGAPTAVPHTARALALAVPQRRTNRWPFADAVLPRAVLANLVAAATAEGATLRMLGRDARSSVLNLVRSAEHEWQADPAYRRELTRWTRDRPDPCDGVPLAAIGPRCDLNHLPLRDLGWARPGSPRKQARFEPSPTVGVLYTPDTVAEWLRAGQALQRTLLTATVHGVSATLMTQPLEIPRLRALMRDPDTGHAAQAVIRFGYGRRPGTFSPRRSQTEVLCQPLSQVEVTPW